MSKFDAEFPTDGLTDEQKHYLDERRAQWRRFVVNHDADRLQIIIDEKPNDTQRAQLRKAASSGRHVSRHGSAS